MTFKVRKGGSGNNRWIEFYTGSRTLLMIQEAYNNTASSPRSVTWPTSFPDAGYKVSVTNYNTSVSSISSAYNKAAGTMTIRTTRARGTGFPLTDPAWYRGIWIDTSNFDDGQLEIGNNANGQYALLKDGATTDWGVQTFSVSGSGNVAHTYPIALDAATRAVWQATSTNSSQTSYCNQVGFTTTVLTTECLAGLSNVTHARDVILDYYVGS